VFPKNAKDGIAKSPRRCSESLASRAAVRFHGTGATVTWDFANTEFSSKNVPDLVAAAGALSRTHPGTVALGRGHKFLGADGRIDGCALIDRAFALVDDDRIPERTGSRSHCSAITSPDSVRRIGGLCRSRGRELRFEKQFLDDLQESRSREEIGWTAKPL